VSLRLLKRKEIDDKKWDSCIADSVSFRHQALTWHMDIVFPGWYGVVYNDYDAVLPLPLSKKYGVKVITQPVFCQQLGIFSEKKLSDGIINEFYKYLNLTFPVLYNFNSFNAPQFVKGVKIKKYPNVELDLKPDYQELYGRYSKNTKRNIKKANSIQLSVTEVSPDIGMLEFHYRNLKFEFNDKKKRAFTRIVERTKKEGILKTFVCRKGNVILSTAFFILINNRLTFIGSSSTSEGYDTADVEDDPIKVNRNICGKRDYSGF